MRGGAWELLPMLNLREQLGHIRQRVFGVSRVRTFIDRFVARLDRANGLVAIGLAGR